ncbi:SDR family NAD(P)-dependent oxidoreductase [Actinomycetospora sp. TBRC 11914]|uniref:SDR family NAD(P)-dependent oxidoreductase n=1 Tax=Actinomycetospora sp. TBRC 11914 TaxID=2729387 RepID=UPI00145EF051|nr:SDR family NAD(P)-dependent oxidoreductase [Actinomycetospora sp. TBRC 11914]NMO89029.1 SDR family NAD(P)-dependent oxidoreductase [Actinomycetospora sp. TBRC 11914]
MSGPRHVLVAGASSGIGAATVAELLERGHHVTASVRAPADAAALEARHDGARLRVVRFDVTDTARMGEVVRDVAAAGPLHAVVANAGIALAAPLAHLPADDLRRVLEVNVVGQVALVQAALPALRRDGGRVVVVGSLAGRLAGPMLGAYAASKAALATTTQVLRAELAPRGVPVVLVEPGVTASAIWDRARDATTDLRARLGPDVAREYDALWDDLAADASHNAERGAPPRRVARAIVREVEAPRPRPRRLVGRDAHLAAAIAVLPGRVRDRLLAARH